MTRIAFIRHGVTAWNKAKRAQGSSNIPLDTDGHFQAEKLAERLRNENLSWDIIFTSDLIRAKQTAEAIQNKFSPIQFQTDSRIREVSGGQIEGTTLEERITKWGNNWREL
ncbi:MAG TPA: histidine phosphatase family protein, partial [Bacillota bacterium]|nr:histidine phosphatase family protein [Bacillota bacterium]